MAPTEGPALTPLHITALPGLTNNSSPSPEKVGGRSRPTADPDDSSSDDDDPHRLPSGWVVRGPDPVPVPVAAARLLESHFAT